jgi:hypothetical protein
LRPCIQAGAEPEQNLIGVKNVLSRANLYAKWRQITILIPFVICPNKIEEKH